MTCSSTLRLKTWSLRVRLASFANVDGHNVRFSPVRSCFSRPPSFFFLFRKPYSHNPKCVSSHSPPSPSFPSLVLQPLYLATVCTSVSLILASSRFVAASNNLGLQKCVRQLSYALLDRSKSQSTPVSTCFHAQRVGCVRTPTSY